MIKDNRKTKENSENQNQFINWIKEYFAEAPIKISNDKTKLYISHNEYPISLENTSIIEKFTNKNKGIDFTREQAIKEAESLRNELVIEVKNYKALEVDLMQNLIKQYFNQFFTYKDCTKDFTIEFYGNYCFRLNYLGSSFDFDFENIASEFLKDKKILDIPFSYASEFYNLITVESVYYTCDYTEFICILLSSIINHNFGVNFDSIELTSQNNQILIEFDVESIDDFDENYLYLDTASIMSKGAYVNFEELANEALNEITCFFEELEENLED